MRVSAPAVDSAKVYYLSRLTVSGCTDCLQVLAPAADSTKSRFVGCLLVVSADWVLAWFAS